MENEGSIETARNPRSREVSEDKKIELIIMQFDRLHISIAGLQETKWFGSSVYQVRGATVLSSGRDVPASSTPGLRGEGVAIVLSGVALRALKDGGCQWKAVSPCLVVAKLLFHSCWLHVVCCYAPTFAQARHAKDAFFNDLRGCLSSVPEKDLYIIVGDFNACVGSGSGGVDDDWRLVRGLHGLGQLNDAGEELLSFLSLFSGRILNTQFSKKDIHKATWQHPRSQRWHCSCIDYIITRQREARRLCTDCMVFFSLCRVQLRL